MPVYRTDMLNQLANRHFDLLVIGGGITGAGVAQDAAHRGLRVALVEKNDFAAGTSHASTKLLHGGIRYLEQGEVKLMYEALHERNRLTRLAPDLAEWLPFLIPIYTRGWQAQRIGIGLWIYDLLAGFPQGRLHRWVPRDEALKMAPHLKADGLRGAYLYYDARTNDTRLTVEVIRSAVKAGATAVNYCRALSLVKQPDGRITGAVVQDQLEPEAQPITVTADAVVNATGPWVDQTVALDQPEAEPQLRPSKGTHLIVPADRLPVEAAVLAFSPSGDGRFIFVVPWQGAVILGTTDTPFDNPDTVAPDKADETYILDAANATFPGARLTSADVISAYAGLRPLIKAEAGSTAKLSREHRIWTTPGGMVNIAGGKLTTYRTMAAAVTDRVLHQLGRAQIPCRTGEIPLGPDRKAAIEALERQYPELAEPLVPGLPHSKAEVAYAAQEEMALFPDDFLARRTRIALLDRFHGEPQRNEVAKLLSRFGRPNAPADQQAI